MKYATHSQDDIQNAISRANQAFKDWSIQTVQNRASVLVRFADLLERHEVELLGLCIKEAGKTIDDAIAEVREAVDFCRYYANEIQRSDLYTGLSPLGAVLCISPWNFPLAIFVGQVVAALVTGNTVLAKPAEQTSLIAMRAIELLYKAGLPNDAIQPLLARGSVVGRITLVDSRVN